MLQLTDIKKQYLMGDKVVNALNGITADFGETGLTAVLGVSGCGKTTLMNIIGGLDRATSGDLIIDGKSTKAYTESDWNDYRNHKIGFVFQSYNLIPHMTAFGNVELALTLSGISVKERKKKVLDALESVGLSDQANKKPNQMSGGQMQRVAIARAIVNNPTILLADEPTGAVDSDTGVQIMQILKEISANCLVVVVTHNQELAFEYASRVIKMQDGLIISDEERESQNASEEVPEQKIKETSAEKSPKKRKKAKMNFSTATKLSFNNLLSKKGRSIITVISAAISVVCIALILAMNSGFAYYISNFEKNNLSRFPIKVSTQTTSFIDLLSNAFDDEGHLDAANVSLTSMLELLKTDQELREKYTDEQLVYLSKLILAIIEKGISGVQNMDNMQANDEYEMLNKIFGITFGTDISEFMRALEQGFDPSWGAIMRNYDINFDIYRKDEEGNEARLNPVDMLIAFLEDSAILSLLQIAPGNISGEINKLLYGEDIKLLREMFDNNTPWSMMIDDATLLNAQYDVLAGRLPAFGTDAAKNEVVLVVDEYNQLDDYTLFMLDKISIESFILSVVNQLRLILPENVSKLIDLFLPIIVPKETEEVKAQYEFSEFIGDEETMPATFVLRIPTDYFALNEETGIYNMTNQGTEVRVVGILRLKEGVSAGVISGAIGYTEALTTALINRGNNAPVIQALNRSLEESNLKKETLLGVAQRIMGLEYEPTALTQITIPARVSVLQEILTLTQTLELTSEQTALLLEVATQLDGFEFTPENQAVIEDIIEILQTLKISEQNYALLWEAVSLIRQANLDPGTAAALIQAARLAATLDPSEENIQAITAVAALLSGLNLSEENITTFTQAALLFRELNLSEENTAVLLGALSRLDEFDLNSQNIATVIGIASVFSGLAVSEERLEDFGEILEVLSGLNTEADPETLQEIAALMGQIIETPSDTSAYSALWDLIGELSSENSAVIGEAWNLIIALELTPEEVSALFEAAQMAGDLDLNSQNLQLIAEVAGFFGEIELSQENIDTLTQIAGLLAGLELSEETIQILAEAATILSEQEISESNLEALNEILTLLGGIELTGDEITFIQQLAGIVVEVELSESDIEALLALAELAATLDLSAPDMVALQNVVRLLDQFDLSAEEQETLYAIVSLVSELNLTSEDIEAAQRIVVLMEQIELSAKEQAALEELFAMLSASDQFDIADLGEILDLVYQINLTEEEQTAAWELVSLALSVLGFSDTDAETVLGFARGIIDLNITADEIELLVEILPTLEELDLTKSENEILNQIGNAFQIRNLTVAEDSAFAWFDAAGLSNLTTGFELKDLMRPNSIDIYPFSIESRNSVLEFINNYNLSVANSEELSGSTIDYSVIYTDELSEMTASMNSMINTITKLLILVAAIAVVVAMLLVAIILFISVQDRTKEIGLLRALGASKGNISSVFIAETFIIGLVSGVVGVCLGLILTFPANKILSSVLGMDNLLRPVWWHQFCLIGVAFVTTIISGIIPAALAAKKDPVLALRTE